LTNRHTIFEIFSILCRHPTTRTNVQLNYAKLVFFANGKILSIGRFGISKFLRREIYWIGRFEISKKSGRFCTMRGPFRTMRGQLMQGSRRDLSKLSHASNNVLSDK